VRAMYEEQVMWAQEEGIDFVIAETNDYLGEALIGLEVIRQFQLPAMVTLTAIQPDCTRDGYDYVEACRVLADHGADIVGLNCSRGPETMLPLIEEIRAAVGCYVAALPVPYRTNADYPTFQSFQTDTGEKAFPLALEPFLCSRLEMAAFAHRMQHIGVNYIGTCCGGAPHYVRAMAEVLGRSVPASRYSPAMDLHPIFGTHEKANTQVR